MVKINDITYGIERWDIMSRAKTYRYEQESTISTEDVKCILLDYNIGKKPLAKLLGWGETTIIRYIEGDIPTCEYSQKLLQIKEDPNYYYDILLRNQDKLTTVAFKKSKKAVLSILTRSKINIVAQYIINRANGEITPRRVQSVLFYSQILSLVFTGKEMFDDLYKENYNNVPYLNLYESMKKNGIKVIDMNTDFITKKERDIIEHVYETLEWYGSKSISALYMLESNEYLTFDYRKKDRTIPMEALKNDYKNIFERYNIVHVKDFSLYVQRRMKELSLKKEILKRV